AVVVHAKPDDLKSQPSGAAGARVACGVIEPAEGGGAATGATAKPPTKHLLVGRRGAHARHELAAVASDLAAGLLALYLSKRQLRLATLRQAVVVRQLPELLRPRRLLQHGGVVLARVLDGAVADARADGLAGLVLPGVELADRCGALLFVGWFLRGRLG